jgi:hypothetical protein
MNKEKKLSGTSRVFLVMVGAIADLTKIALDLLFGIGFILDPLIISPITLVIFWITLAHNNVSMFSGHHAWMGWTNLVIAEIPGVDAFPDWTMYALFV